MNRACTIALVLAMGCGGDGGSEDTGVDDGPVEILDVASDRLDEDAGDDPVEDVIEESSDPVEEEPGLPPDEAFHACLEDGTLVRLGEPWTLVEGVQTTLCGEWCTHSLWHLLHGGGYWVWSIFAQIGLMDEVVFIGGVDGSGAGSRYTFPSTASGVFWDAGMLGDELLLVMGPASMFEPLALSGLRVTPGTWETFGVTLEGMGPHDDYRVAFLDDHLVANFWATNMSLTEQMIQIFDTDGHLTGELHDTMSGPFFGETADLIPGPGHVAVASALTNRIRVLSETGSLAEGASFTFIHPPALVTGDDDGFLAFTTSGVDWQATRFDLAGMTEFTWRPLGVSLQADTDGDPRPLLWTGIAYLALVQDPADTGRLAIVELMPDAATGGTFSIEGPPSFGQDVMPAWSGSEFAVAYLQPAGGSTDLLLTRYGCP
jgi:hypothetical protein